MIKYNPAVFAHTGMKTVHFFLCRSYDTFNAEWGRLLIEQQTFGATAQIGTRAVTQLRMYSPPAAQTVVISLPMTSEDQK